MDNISIRNLNVEDIPYIRQCVDMCPPLDQHTPFTYWVIAQYYGKSCFVMLEGEKIIGFITSMRSADNVLYIWQIGIMQGYRGKGFSQMLIDKVLAYAREYAVAAIQISMLETNVQSVSAFRKYFQSKNLRMEKVGEISIKDFLIPDFFDFEDLYEVSLL